MSNLAKARARKLLEEYAINSPSELDLMNIAYGETIVIEEADLDGYLGRITYKANLGIIKIHKCINEEGQKRFVIAHELGHFFNYSRNGENCSELNMMAFKSQNEIEQNANIFASELLMPEEWLIEFVKTEKPGIKLVQKTAEYFNVSLSAAALRIAQTDVYPMAVIMSTNGKVKWSSISEYFPFHWIPVGYKVNPNSYAYDIFKSQTVIAGGVHARRGGKQSQPEQVLADSWFLDDKNYKRDYFLIEQNFPLPNYNSVLTILLEDA
ncbi:MAG: ImmA/IrrE family metallo-endopeptidase [Ignavibacteria bacterium]|jgi:Zn-dependent peptidase ImmA (M78 family)